MPSVGTRRSTRVFVPKATKPARGVRCCGDRLALSKSHWPKDAFHHRPPPAPSTRSFGIVYSRKRKRKLPAQPKHDDARFGIVFTRKDKRPKVAPSLHDNPSYIPCSCSSSSREFASRIGFLDLDAKPSTLVDNGVALLVVLVDTSCSGSSHHFLRLLLPLLRWMRHHSQRSKLRNLASFLSSAALATVFASLGLHFIKLRRRRTSSSFQRTMATVHCGWCELRDANQSRPLLSVNFSALPSYFQSLHSMIALRSIYLPAIFQRSMGLVGRTEEMYPRDALEADSWSPSALNVEPAVDLRCDDACRVFQDYVPPKQVSGSAMHALRLKKHKRKRSSMRRPVSRRRLAARFPDMAIGMKQGTMTSLTELKPALTGPEVSVKPFQPKPAFDISLDLLENMDDSDVSTPVRSNGKQKGSSFKSPVEHTHEKLHLSEVRQNIDSFLCKANLLIIQADRCWREEGAVVMLELSNRNGWCIAVKLNSVTRFSLKPSEQRFYVVNRINHAYIWAVEDGWKLEFSDKSDWLLFKELHIEGRERNSQRKIIPIPGVHEVSDGVGGVVTDPFSRPVPDYIRMVDDEVARALSRDSAYDMDSEDEQWLIQLNHGASDRRSSHLNHISFEDFEKIITLLEREAYNNPKGTSDVDQLLSTYPAIGKDDNVLAVYEYWISKRYKKGAPLLRVFQGAPVRRGRLSEKSSVKKKRSLKRPKRQTGRGKPGIFLRDNAEEEALQRVVEAERAAKQAVERAVQLRSRAQSLMENANLATYKSVMAVRIAEAASISDSSRDLVWRALD
ncbi:uncharacterized protein LOC100842864 [Brachypodium distachyon]|uniref:Enhancer of polycomb-like protein n=1 Tax=Brachypodium distachyon TaxID=15368 RepID=I1HVX7_BRADI|nr:uncharacterized protein LOC100842864 [Brachypodium distachyon]KQJ92722.1 hypothetical protein BRADI_3g00240v3 [Brachypodium distachyon]|eukprot:XP_010233644.1 uncharacterized protein LOC100842864 [Brachypodium distachyon]